METTIKPEDRILLPVEDVARLTSLGVRTIWKLSKEGTFPRPVRVLSRVLWRRADIEAWAEQL